MEGSEGNCHTCGFVVLSSSSLSVQCREGGLMSLWAVLVLSLIYAFWAEISR